MPEPFYPASCHPSLSRRRVLVGSGAMLAAAAVGREVAGASDEGVGVIRRYAGRGDDPWATAHGVRAMGRDFTIEGGRRAVDYLLATFVTTVPANGRTALGFPADVEVHPNAFLKTFLEAGVGLDHGFTLAGQRRTLQDLADGARLTFRPRLVAGSPNALPWSIIALTLTSTPVRRQWTNAWGEPVDLDAVVEHALGLLERASAPVLQAMTEGKPLTAQAPVHGFTCGGTHMLYCLLVAASMGYAGPERLERVRRQVDVMVWRMGADVALIERFYRERSGRPGAFWYELDSKLKLVGHAEECLAFAEQRNVVTLSPAQQSERRVAVAGLRRMLEDLGARDVTQARAVDRELFRQIVGDTCHARRGLTLDMTRA